MESVNFIINNVLICFEGDIETCKLLLTGNTYIYETIACTTLE